MMKMDKGLKEVCDGIKKIITITGKIEWRLDSVDTELIKMWQKEMGSDIRAIRDKLEV